LVGMFKINTNGIKEVSTTYEIASSRNWVIKNSQLSLFYKVKMV
jgi:hypothetical protein